MRYAIGSTPARRHEPRIEYAIVARSPPKSAPANRKFLRVRAVRTCDTRPGRNLATKALGYAVNQETELRGVLDDGGLPLDNTRSERALREIVVGRKNWMFYGSDTHAEAAAALFSLLTSCRLHGLDPFRHLDEVMRVLPYWPDERYLELAPKHWKDRGQPIGLVRVAVRSVDGDV